MAKASKKRTSRRKPKSPAVQVGAKGTWRSFDSADEAFVGCLRDLLKAPTRSPARDAKSTGAGKGTREILNYGFTLRDPTRRLAYNAARQLNLFSAIGRFFWMLSGSDRVSDVSYYEPKVTSFSDDGLFIPGSNYGTRLIRPSANVNQIAGAIHRLSSDPETRRAACVVWQPEDAVRESTDIPCSFGIFLHRYDDGLHLTHVMRSNAVWNLLPYNIFEFTLLGEVIARCLGMRLTAYHHLAVSFHLYETNVEKARGAIRAASEPAGPVQDMGPLPDYVFPPDLTSSAPVLPDGFNKGKRIARGKPVLLHMSPVERFTVFREVMCTIEQEIRLAQPSLRPANAERQILRYRKWLGHYWGDFAGSLILFALSKTEDNVYAISSLAKHLDDPFRWYVEQIAMPLFRRPADSS